MLPIGRQSFPRPGATSAARGAGVGGTAASGADRDTHDLRDQHSMRSFHDLPKLSAKDKADITGVAAPTWPEEISSIVERKGEPLFWQELKRVRVFMNLYQDFRAQKIFDLTAGTGAAAVAALALGLQYDGCAMGDRHAEMLNGLLDKACFYVLADESSDSKLGEDILQHFGLLIDQGRAMFDPTVDAEENGDDEKDLDE